MIFPRLNRLLALALMTICILVAGVVYTRAEIPKLISYQGRLTDADGNPVADGDHILTFQIVEHDPLPMGESPLWSSGPQTVTTVNGLFSYYLGSNVSLPTEIFNDDGLDSYFLRIQVQGSLLFLKGTQLVTVPFSVRSTYSDTAAYALAGSGGGSASGWVDDGSVVRLQSDGDRVGIGTNNPSERLVVGKDLGSYAGEVLVVGNDAAGSYSAVKLGEDADNCANLLWSNDDNYLTLNTKEGGVVYDPILIRGGKLSIGDEFPFAAITSRVSGTAILGEDTPGTMGGVGVLGKSSDELGTGVRGMGMGANGYGVNGHAYGAGGYGVYAQATSDARIALYAEADVPSGVAIEAHCGTSGMAGKFYGNVALYSPSDNHMIIMFGEGLDYAEGFHSSAPRKAEPGTVMSIDPIHPGKLTISVTAYDTKVAGIVAGANNLGSGVRLGTDGFDLDVALAGRVYCNVEATQHAIQPGDLLTTSSIPGYAMKATEYDRARGAVLGKAMQSLAQGEKGQILVLVTLQ